MTIAHGSAFSWLRVNIDLRFGFGKKSDAKGDQYKNVESVFGTIYNDRFTVSNANKKLYGTDRNDTLIAFGGTDQCWTDGEGADLYMLEQAFGMKVINNYAKDIAGDTLSNSTDAMRLLAKK